MVTANDIFEQLIKDPEYIGREDEARGEAEYRARQHHNNIRALALATSDNEPSAIKQLSDFFLKDYKFDELYNMGSSDYSSKKIESEISKVIAVNATTNLSSKAQAFLETLAKHNVPTETMVTLTNIANGKEDDKWIDGLIKQLSTNQQMASEFGITQSIQKQLHADFTSQGFDVPKVGYAKPTMRSELTDFYGKNSKADLEAPASIERLNEALKKMGRKETAGIGSSNKLNFQSGNTEQWKKVIEDTGSGKRVYHSMIQGKNPTDSGDVIKSADLDNYTVAQILHAMHMYTTKGGGRFDVTPEQVSANEQHEAEIEKQGQAQKEEEQKELANNPNIDNSEIPADETEAKTTYSTPENKDKNVPHVIFGGHLKDHPAILTGVAHGLCTEDGVMTPMGTALMHHAKGDGWGHKGHIFHHKKQNAHVLTWDGLNDIVNNFNLMPGKNLDTGKYHNEDILKDKIADALANLGSLDEAVEHQSEISQPEGVDIEPIPEEESEPLSPQSDNVMHWDNMETLGTALGVAHSDPMTFQSYKDNIHTQLATAVDAFKTSDAGATSTQDMEGQILSGVPDDLKMDVLSGIASHATTNDDAQLAYAEDWGAISHLQDLHTALADIEEAYSNGEDTTDQFSNAVGAMERVDETNLGKLAPHTFSDLMHTHAPSFANEVISEHGDKHPISQLQHMYEMAGHDANDDLAPVNSPQFPDIKEQHNQQTAQTEEQHEVPQEAEIGKHKADVFAHIQDLHDVYASQEQMGFLDGDSAEELQDIAQKVQTSLNALGEAGASPAEIKEHVNSTLNNFSNFAELEDFDIDVPSGATAPPPSDTEEATEPVDEPTETAQTEMSDEPTTEELLDPTVETPPTPTDFETTPATPSEEEMQAKHDAKKDKVMSAIFGDDLDNEDAQLYSEWLDENPKEVAGAYKQHVIGGVLNKIKDKVKNAEKEQAEQAKQKEKQAEQETVEASAQQESEKQQAVEEANTLPHNNGDLDKLAKEDDFSSVTATHHARELIAHKQKHEDNMKASSKLKMKKMLMEAAKHGADFDQLESEMKEHGDNFGSPEHMKEAHEADLHEHDKHTNYKDLLTNKSEAHIEARQNSFHHGAYNKFTEFDEETGKPNGETHVQYDDSGRAHKIDDVNNNKRTFPQLDDDHKLDGESRDTHHKGTGEALGTHHMLQTLDPHQKMLADTYKEAVAKGDDDTAGEMLDKLEEQGIDPKAVTGEHHEDDAPKHGPPDPEVARQKMAEGYVWHEETRHWIKKESLDDLHGMHSGHDASLVSASHGGDKPFALNEDGGASDKNFLLHGSGNLMGVGSTDPKPGKNGFASHNDVVENSLAHALTESGHLEGHQGVQKISNFSHPTKGTNIGKNAGFGGSHMSHPNPKSGIKSAIAGAKSFKAGATSFKNDAISAWKAGWSQGKGGGGGEEVEKSMDSSDAIQRFVKAYADDTHLARKKKVEDILEKGSIIH